MANIAYAELLSVLEAARELEAAVDAWANTDVSDQAEAEQDRIHLTAFELHQAIQNADAALATHPQEAKPSCPYCGTTEGLRIANDGGGYEAPDYICEDCFTPRDDGPSFDDLPHPQED